jgi:acetoin utilization protein AcuB
MNVADMMTVKPVTIYQNETLRQALDAMARIGCHHLPVLSHEGHIVGVITDSNCRRALRAPDGHLQDWDEESAAGRIQVRSVMTPAPIIVEPDMSADEAARLMLTHHVSCLPVMRSETLVGIITTSDILMAFIRMHKRETLNNL